MDIRVVICDWHDDVVRSILLDYVPIIVVDVVRCDNDSGVDYEVHLDLVGSVVRVDVDVEVLLIDCGVFWTVRTMMTIFWM